MNSENLPGVDPKLVSVAEAVRATLEKVFWRHRNCRNLCAMAAYAIAVLCKERGIEAVVCSGTYREVMPIGKPEFGNPEHIAVARCSPRTPEGHAWIKHRQNYVDVTLTQFEADAPRIAILPLGDSRYCGGMLRSLDGIRWQLSHVCGYDDEQVEQLMTTARGLLALAVIPHLPRKAAAGKGGKAALGRLTREQRTALAKKAAAARWGKK